MMTLIISIIFIFLGLCAIAIGFVLFYKANQLKIQHDQQQQLINQHLRDETKSWQNALYEAQVQYNKNKEQLQKSNDIWKKNKEEELQTWLTEKQNYYQQRAQSSQAYSEQRIEQANQQFKMYQEQIQKEKEAANKELEKIKSSLTAGIEANLRQQQKKEKINFYKISINEADMADIQMLENLKLSFRKPVVLSKLIWSQYFQKQVTQLCDRLTGKKTICGIYKITDLLTQQCYIGQSVDISQRFKSHCKCGLGIDAPATNKLYNTMQKDKLWNFTFEILEECPREQLNEKEAFWINMYQSNVFGMNGNKGVNK